ncbi:hypothetical protein Lbir_1190 [Legionella birminghamensis]|uniref:Transmembrane protein n=1 Tax=Legionella birminghamensis TaxID=28083 RepID=A0A378I5R9_9GAMM|nr:hypothetical protein [Legionella birminghamensis]KTC72415.1 hypothetical protein Lbir_1190 [Legionella birminghamensis]STX30547.1 Uncharacterised protein [Legionella birminghamensis]
MNEKFQQLFQTLIPFLLLGIAISLLVGLFIMFSYVLVWGILIGGTLWIFATIKRLLFPSKKVVKTSGRIIEHKDHD